MAVVFVLVAALLVFAIAAVAVGRTAGQLSASARGSVFDLDEAVAFVADHLPDRVAAAVTADDVRRILGWHLEYLRAKGVPSDPGNGDGRGPAVVVDDTEPLAHVLGRAAEAGLHVDDEAVLAVLDAELAYLDAIGAVGPPAPPPHLPPAEK